MKTRVTIDVSEDVVNWLRSRYGKRKGIKTLLLLAANEVIGLEAIAYLNKKGYAPITKEANGDQTSN